MSLAPDASPLQARGRWLFPIYLFGMATSFAANGLQTVLFPWLAAVVLNQPPAMVGIAQTALMAPSIVFMLLAGVVADRGDPRRILIRVHLMLSLPPLGLSAIIYFGALSLPALLVYGVIVGTIGAFAVPARDAMLPRVAGGPLGRAVALATALQFVSQLLGIAAAFLADRVGAPALLILQAAIIGSGAMAASLLVRTPPAPHTGARPGRLAAVIDGFRAAGRESRIWPVLVLMLAIGFFYGGSFMVTMPIAVRDVYGRSADGIALTNLAFWIGSIATSFTIAGLSARIHRPGALVLGAAVYGVCILVLLGTLPAWNLLLATCLLWGFGAGVTMTLGRTIVQTLSSADMRGRMMALFQLGFLGGTPLGALVMGGVTQLVGPSHAMWIAAAGMCCVLLFLATRSRLFGVRL